MPHTLIHGSAHRLPEIADKSVHLIATSPPYMGLRKYSGDQCVDWQAVDYSPMAGLPPVHVDAMRCELGLEPTIEAYIGHLILCLREWWRVLRDDSCAFVNLGDSYFGSNQTGGTNSISGIGKSQPHLKRARVIANGLKPKDLMMIPSRFALAAQADGWFLRSAIVWAKGVSFIPHYAGSCMPESVQDRPTNGYEMVYMLAKSPSYYYDADAVREQYIYESPNGNTWEQRKYRGEPIRRGQEPYENEGFAPGGFSQTNTGRNLRNVWAINPQPWSSKKDVDHFACWPEALVTPMIKCGTSQHGCCAACGSPWARVVEREGETTTEKRKRLGDSDKRGAGGRLVVQNLDYAGAHGNNARIHTTTGWQPTCSCYGHFEEVDDGSDWVTEETGIRRKRTVYVPDGPQPDPIPATVLDPFAGSGTSLRAAMKLGRNSIGVDISDQYLTDLVPERTSNIQMEMPL